MRGEEAGFEHFAHDADVGVRGFGPTRDAAFEQAALALMRVMADGEVRPATMIEVTCEAPDDALLLVDWLNALLYESARRGMLFSRFAVRIEDHRLSGRAWGEPIDPARHRIGVEVKGATYTALTVDRQPDGRWVAGCVVDV